MSGRAVPDASWMRLGALSSLPPFLALIWRTSPALTSAMLVLRLARAVLPVATLFVGKLIIDEVVLLSRLPGAPAGPAAWWDSGLLSPLLLLLGAELCLALLADGRPRRLAAGPAAVRAVQRRGEPAADAPHRDAGPAGPRR